MMCEKPYMQTPVAVSQQQLSCWDGGREAALPRPCGKCLHCRINKAREWQHRLMLEYRLHFHSAFLTLTYSDEYLPPGDLLVKRDVQLFLKKFRSWYRRRIRYFCAGEYGDKSGRPHYHLILFGVSALQEDYLDVKSGIESCWSKGFVDLVPMSDGLCRYITKYATKDVMAVKKGWYLMSRGRKRGQGIGGPAMLKVAAIIRKRFAGMEYPVVRELQHGEHTLPLGRYLMEVLVDDLGISQDRVKLEAYEYQERELFSKIVLPVLKKHSGSFDWYSAVQSLTEDERLQRKARYRNCGR